MTNMAKGIKTTLSELFSIPLPSESKAENQYFITNHLLVLDTDTSSNTEQA